MHPTPTSKASEVILGPKALPARPIPASQPAVSVPTGGLNPPLVPREAVESSPHAALPQPPTHLPPLPAALSASSPAITPAKQSVSPPPVAVTDRPPLPAPLPATLLLDPLATTKLGITLRGLRKLRGQFEAYFGPDYKNISTDTICEEFVKPVTVGRLCRLAEAPELVASEDLGEPLYFISHAWGNSFEGLFCAIETFLASADEETRVWIDLISVNQHTGSECKKLDMKAFNHAIHIAKAGTLVVTDLTKCNPASRAWCLFEWAYTLSTHGPDGLHMSLAPADRTALMRDLDIGKAQCKKPEDKERIIRDITAQHGSVEAFNTKLRLQLLLEPLSYRVDLRRLNEAARGTSWRLGAVQDWLEGGRGCASGSGGRLLCISGGAGEGKSTVAAVLCSQMAPPAPQQQQEQPQQSGGFSGCVTVHHFLKYSDQRRLDPVRIVKSLAFQLACRIPSVAEYLLGLDGLEVVHLADVEAAVELLLRKPLSQMNCTPPGVVMLIDALDEADPPSLQLGRSGSSASPPLPMCPLVRGNRALELLTAHLAKLPPWVRFIVTTRPEAAAGQVLPCLRRTFTAAGGAGGVTVLAPGDLRAAGPESGSMAAARGDGDKCGDGGGGCADGRGVMLYHTAAKVLDLYRQPPTPCTEEVRQGDNPEPPTLQDVYHLYDRIFKASFAQACGSGEAGAIASCGFSSREGAVSEVLAVLLAAQEPPSQSLMQQLGLGPFIPLLPGYQDLFFVDEHHVYLFHKSLATWLMDPDLSGPFAPQVARGHALIGLHLARFWKQTRAPQALKYVVHHLAAAIAAAVAADAAGGSSDTYPGSRSAVDAPAAASSTPATSSNRGIAGGRLRTTAALQREAGKLLDALLLDFGFIRAALAAGHGHVVISGLASIPMERRTEYCYDVLRWLRSEQHRLAGKSAKEIVHAVTGGFGVASTSRLYEAARIVACKQRWWKGMVLPRSIAGWSNSVAILRGRTCAFSPDGRQLASCQWRDNRIYVWDVATGHLTATLADDGMSYVDCVVFSHGDGRAIASASRDGTVHILDTATGSCTAVLLGHQEDMCRVAFSPHDTKLLAIANGDKTVGLWDVERAACLAKLKGHRDSVTDLAFSPVTVGLLASCSCWDSTVRLWDTTSGQCTGVLVGRTVVHCIAFSPTDDKLLASGDAYNRVRLWDVSTGQETKVLEGHKEWVSCVAFSPSGAQLASGSYDTTIRVWNVGSGECCAVLRGHTDRVVSVAFSPVRDNPLLASGSDDGNIRIWELAGPGRRQQQSAPVGSSPGEGHGSGVECVAFSKLHSDWLASGGEDGMVRLWSIRTGECLKVLRGHCRPVNCLAFSPVTRSQLASGSNDHTVRLWDCTLRLWDVGTAVSVELMGHQRGVLCLAFTGDGKLLASGDEEGAVRVWDVATRQCTRDIKTGHRDVSSLTFSPGDNTLLCTGYCKGDGAKVWDLTTGRCLHHVLRSLGFVQVVFAACKGNNGAGTGGLVLYIVGKDEDKGGLNVYELELHPPQLRGSAGQPSELRRMAINEPRLLCSTGQYDDPHSLALSPSGRLLAVSDVTGRVSLLKVETGAWVVELGGKGFPPAHSLAFRPSDDLTLACGYDDSTVRVWEPARWALL